LTVKKTLQGKVEFAEWEGIDGGRRILMGDLYASNSPMAF
jgi:hypothetical protein